MNQAKHIAFKVSSCSFDWILFTCRYPFFVSNILRKMLLHLYKLHCSNLQHWTPSPIFLWLPSELWKFESWSWSWIRISISFNFLVIEESDKTISWLLSDSFWKSFELNISFWLNICFIASSIIFVLEPSLTLEIFLLLVLFPGFYCSDCK